MERRTFLKGLIPALVVGAVGVKIPNGLPDKLPPEAIAQRMELGNDWHMFSINIYKPKGDTSLTLCNNDNNLMRWIL